MKTIYLAAQEASTRAWYPVARVDQAEDGFVLRYTKGVEKVSGFTGFGRMNRLDVGYYSEELFPLLKNRVMARNRADFPAFARWLGRDAADLSPFEELSYTGGLRGTDSLELVPVPERTPDGAYEASFFIHGVRYLSEGSQKQFSTLTLGDELLLVRDVQNPADRYALLLRTKTNACLVGYVPRYYSHDFSSLLESEGRGVAVTVARVNLDAPAAFRVLCTLTSPWPATFDTCRQDEYNVVSTGAVQLHVVS